MEIVLAITAPYFTAGAVFRILTIATANGPLRLWECVEAAPIIKYMVGMNSTQVKNYCDRKRWKHESIKLKEG